MDKPSRTGQETDQKQSEDRTRDDFNEEQMSTTPAGVPVETDPVKPDDKVRLPRIPGVASS